MTSKSILAIGHKGCNLQVCLGLNSWVFPVLVPVFRLSDAHTLFRPYNARLTREAVALRFATWKGRKPEGSGATFADTTHLFDPRAKGVTATLSRVESIVIRR